MNFEPTDYIQHLNLDLDSVVSPTMTQQQLEHELDLFSQAHDFFSLDVLGKDNIVPIKQEVPQDLSFFKFDVHQGPQQTVSNEVTQQPPKRQKRSISEFSPIPETPSEYVACEAAVEDKRKRNTAASARFRIKKKLKEQEMERKSKELEERVIFLEKKLKQVEMENKYLKNMVLQQNEQKNNDLLESIKKRSILDSNPVFQYTN
ncbi:uncharacterized protein J8A68_003096 [[Candida] subhashii]|uniref:BZIP domain-containing protein n=1 Tax=[Candida] subhashii TaxID=561895 RepID=A0A8J5UI27_9ASCO|nr:uncharacterized protein J8A68_003096 [[Candida] subhashii]KAG7663348.1 hypothetical protein J8A68_003096 [[Candida] subhashii]